MTKKMNKPLFKVGDRIVVTDKESPHPLNVAGRVEKVYLQERNGYKGCNLLVRYDDIYIVEDGWKEFDGFVSKKGHLDLIDPDVVTPESEVSWLT